MGAYIPRVGPFRLRAATGPKGAVGHFGSLVRAINYQQLAGKAAAAIHGRFLALFPDGLTPEAVLSTPVEALRGAGLSGAKAAAVIDLAAKVADGTVSLDRMNRLPDDEIVRQLTVVRGIGRWTAEMFLIFQLRRLDVWPVDDLGVRNGWSRIHGLPEIIGPRVLEAEGEVFRPYRTIAAWYCWRAVDTVIPDAPP